MFPLVWEGLLFLTGSLLFWRMQPHIGFQTSRILLTAVVFLKHPGPSEMSYELKLPGFISNLADVVQWFIKVLPEDVFLIPSIDTVTMGTNFR